MVDPVTIRVSRYFSPWSSNAKENAVWVSRGVEGKRFSDKTSGPDGPDAGLHIQFFELSRERISTPAE